MVSLETVSLVPLTVEFTIQLALVDIKGMAVAAGAVDYSRNDNCEKERDPNRNDKRLILMGEKLRTPSHPHFRD